MTRPAAVYARVLGPPGGEPHHIQPVLAALVGYAASHGYLVSAWSKYPIALKT
jgi:hypothetical protein